MTKIIFLINLFIISSCSALSNYIDTGSFLYDSYRGDDLVSKSLFSSKEFSFISVKSNFISHSLLVLLQHEDNVSEWIDADGSKLITSEGRIITTLGLDHDMSMFLTDYSINEGNYHGRISFYNPNARNLLFSSLIRNVGDEYIEYLGEKLLTQKFIEYIVIPSIKVSYENIYWKGLDGNVVKTYQKTHPLDKQKKITFYYKY